MFAFLSATDESFHGLSRRTVVVPIVVMSPGCSSHRGMTILRGLTQVNIVKWLIRCKIFGGLYYTIIASNKRCRGYKGVGYRSVYFCGWYMVVQRVCGLFLCDRIRIRLCGCSGALPSNYICNLYAHPGTTCVPPGTPIYIQALLLSIKQHAISL